MSVNNDRPIISAFSGLRQRPTHEVDEAEDLGLIDYPGFVTIFGNIDWRHEVNQAEWVRPQTQQELSVSSSRWSLRATGGLPDLTGWILILSVPAAVLGLGMTIAWVLGGLRDPN